MQNAIFKYPSDISNETGVLSRAHYRSFCSRPRIIPCESRKKEKKPNKEKNHMHYFSATSDVSSKQT